MFFYVVAISANITGKYKLCRFEIMIDDNQMKTEEKLHKDKVSYEQSKKLLMDKLDIAKKTTTIKQKVMQF